MFSVSKIEFDIAVCDFVSINPCFIICKKMVINVSTLDLSFLVVIHSAVFFSPKKAQICIKGAQKGSSAKKPRHRSCAFCTLGP